MIHTVLKFKIAFVAKCDIDIFLHSSIFFHYSHIQIHSDSMTV